MIEDGSILIQDRRILSVGPTRRIENLKESRGAIDVPVQVALSCRVLLILPSTSAFIENRRSPESVAKRKKALKFYEESLTLIRSCLQHGTLNAQFKVYSDAWSPAADVAALRQLGTIGAVPVGTVAVCACAERF